MVTNFIKDNWTSGEELEQHVWAMTTLNTLGSVMAILSASSTSSLLRSQLPKECLSSQMLAVV